jgi:hypothetical protein
VGGSSTDFARKTNSSDILIQENTSNGEPLKNSMLETKELKKRSETLPTKRLQKFLN